MTCIVRSLAVLIGLSLLNPAFGAVRQVKCDKGGSLSKAIETARPGDTLLLSGNCEGGIVIRQGGLTIDGQGAAAIEPSDPGLDVLVLDGARDIVLKGLTIRNGREGILAINNAVFAAEDVTIEGNDLHGIELIRASAQLTGVRSNDNTRVGVIAARNSLVALTDSTLERNLTGLVVFSNSVARLFGTVASGTSLTQGVTVGLGGAIFAIGSTLTVEDSGAEGLLLLQDGHAQFIGGTLTVRDGGLDGIRLRQSSSLVLGIDAFGVPGQATIVDNVRHGIALAQGSDVSAEGIMPTTVTGNGGSGVRADGASRVTLSGASIVANGAADLDLAFGSQATISATALGSILCDDTVLIRGAACP